MASRLETLQLYKVSYVVLQCHKPLLAINGVYVIALDVSDVVDQIKRKCVGIELSAPLPDGTTFCGIADAVSVVSVEHQGCLHGITDPAYAVILECDRQERSGV